MTDLVSTRTKSILNQLFVVAATLLLGSAIHVGFVAGTAAPTSPAVVLRAVAGVACGAAGFWLRPSRDRRAPTSGGGEGDGDTEAAGDDFDPEVSPLSADDFEDLDRDDG